MADETINIAVQETGTLDVIQLLERLGLTGYEATNRAAEGWVNYSKAQSVATNSEKIVAAALQAGITNINTLRTALDALTTQELAQAAGTKRLADFQKQLADAYGTTARMAAEAAAAERAAAAASDAAALAASRAAGRASAPGSFAAGGPNAAPAAANAASSFSGQANAATANLAAYQAMTGGVNAATAAVGAMHVANTTASGSLSRMAASAKEATGMISGLAASVGIYLTATAAMHASDEYTNISNQLHIATTSTLQFNEQYKSLLNIANASQTDFEAVVKLFARMQAATSGTGVSVEKLDNAVKGMAMGLRLSGTTAAETTRLLREMSEALAMGELKGRQLQSMLANSPIFMKQLGDAMGVNLFDGMHKAEAATVDYTGKLAVLDAKHAASAQAAVGSSASIENALKRESDAQTKNLAGWAAGSETNAKFVASSQKNAAAIDATNAKLTAAKSHEDAVANARNIGYEVERKSIEAHMEHAKSLDTLNLSAENVVNGLVKMGLTTNGLTIDQTTFGGALQVLHNQFVNLFRDGTDANTWMTTLKGLILVVANNLNIVIPAVVALGVAFVGLKLVVLTSQFVEASAALLKFAAASVAFIATPLGLTITAIALAIGGVISVTGKWKDIQDATTKLVQSGNQSIQDALKSTSAGYDQIAASATKAAAAANEAALAMGKSMGLTTSNNQFNYLLTGGANDLSRQAANSNLTQDQLSQYMQNSQPQFRNGGTFVPGGTGTDTIPVSFMVSPGERIIVQTPAQAAGHVPTPHNDNGRAYGSGGHWTPGTGFGVNLGTGLSTSAIVGGSVTGYTPTPLPNSGSATGTGILSAAPANNNTAGSASAGGVDLADVVGWSTLTLASSRAAAIAAGVGAVKEIFDANFADYGKAVEQLDRNFMIVGGKYAGALFDSSNNQIMGNTLLPTDPVRNIALNYAILNAQGQAAFGQANTQVAQTGTALASGYALPANPTLAQVFANQYATQGNFALAAMYANSANTYSWGSPPPMGYDSFGNAVFAGSANVFGNGGAATARITGSTWNGIVPSPTFGGINSTQSGYNSGSLGYSDMQNTIQNVGAGGHYIPGTGIWVPNLVTSGNAMLMDSQGNVYKKPTSTTGYTSSFTGTNPQIIGNVSGSRPTAYYNGTDPVSGHSDVPNGYRNGGDLYVPGSGGVDSQMIRLAVSPGETVHVRTPAQRAAANGMNQVNNITTIVHAKDVDSFGQSQTQFAASQMRMARRVARRIA